MRKLSRSRNTRKIINKRFYRQYKEDIQQGERNNRYSTARRKDLDLDAKKKTVIEIQQLN